MKVKLLFVNTPIGVLACDDVPLGPGPLGNSLHNAVRLLHAQGRIPSCSNISGVKYQGANVDPAASPAALFGVPSQVPVLSVECVWTVLAPSAWSRFGGLSPGPSPSKPGLEPDEPIGPLVDATRGKPKLRVYFSSALFEGFQNGDADYIEAVVHGLRVLDVHAVRLVGRCNALDAHQRRLMEAGELLGLDYDAPNNDVRNAVKQLAAYTKIKAYLLGELKKHPKVAHVLHIQSRYPESGSAFNDERIRELRKEGIHVVSTVHEFKFNFLLPVTTSRNVGVLNQYCRSSERVIFLNDHDLNNAVKSAQATKLRVPETLVLTHEQVQEASATLDAPDLAQRAVHIPVVITVPSQPIDTREILAREVAVISFGMIRHLIVAQDAIRLAKQFKDGKKPWRVVVAGKASDAETVKLLMKNAYGRNMLLAVEPGWEAIVNQACADTNVQALLDLNTRCRDLRRLFPGALKTYNDQLKSPDWTDKEQQAREKGVRLGKLKQGLVVAADGDEQARLEREIAVLKLAKPTKPIGPDENTLPIDLHFNVSPEQLILLFRQCKYAFKQDARGMSDNASSIISCMANGCITFTKQGGMTPNEYRVSGPKKKPISEYVRRYLDRVQVDEARYDPRSGTVEFAYVGPFKDAVITRGQKNLEYDVKGIYEEIAKREQDKSQSANKATIAAMSKVLERHRASTVALEHLKLYLELVPLKLTYLLPVAKT
ncbi:hypothetical protein [Hyalangium rubrum]|uniref:Uncharacterized protein n=1 Tax=Hyalangium rubrum TaxID=3103134 RepID=A0ABU5H1F8_9BACT|nr:hypothetical protein [Hyalangium sp. s54d21]MDY7227146.1 hypothetical protein [Hyalangium sp. s54d21]